MVKSQFYKTTYQLMHKFFTFRNKKTAWAIYLASGGLHHLHSQFVKVYVRVNKFLFLKFQSN